MKTKAKEYVFEKEIGYSFSIKSFVTWGENYPLQKTMVNHDHERIVAMRGREIGDQVNRQLLEQVGIWQKLRRDRNFPVLQYISYE